MLQTGYYVVQEVRHWDAKTSKNSEAGISKTGGQ